MPAQIEFLNPGVLNLLNRDLQAVGREFSKRGGLREPIIESVRDVLIPSIRQNFLEGGRPSWEPASAMTLARAGHHGSTLMRSRKLYNAATAYARWVVVENTATYDLRSLPEKAWYGIVHQDAEIAERSGMDHRPFAQFHPDDPPQIADIFLQWVEKKIEQKMRRVYR